MNQNVGTRTKELEQRNQNFGISAISRPSVQSHIKILREENFLDLIKGGELAQDEFAIQRAGKG